MKSHEVLSLIEEITRNDDSKYFELSNMVQNGRAELAVQRGFLKEVRILQLNIPRSSHVINYEKYINENFEMPIEAFTEYQEWHRTEEAQNDLDAILMDNHIE
ncbi:hypothetical protein [Dellaglioa algida]|uniref:Uncharacterized protein n=1 Tax=Dellaglioa algida TaxID=105612 RepID=A0A2C8EPA7_9LACO|nr:hypothetical protein [Dellaglioa algida]MDK1716901.1 hypothetical protein [Dellaglioa algida]MDK1718853.1 hypothetical protein [Dellaglioa algida]MDK1719675.1 hypothetical protein [Dellaglioa algida]MDK1721864.1 hypothetical protein [Dellaglioa algida]MDK1723018.1 hypothetical protein [Dellaglioa algida]